MHAQTGRVKVLSAFFDNQLHTRLNKAGIDTLQHSWFCPGDREGSPVKQICLCSAGSELSICALQGSVQKAWMPMCLYQRELHCSLESRVTKNRGHFCTLLSGKTLVSVHILDQNPAVACCTSQSCFLLGLFPHKRLVSKCRQSWVHPAKELIVLLLQAFKSLSGIFPEGLSLFLSVSSWWFSC